MNCRGHRSAAPRGFRASATHELRHLASDAFRRAAARPPFAHRRRATAAAAAPDATANRGQHSRRRRSARVRPPEQRAIASHCCNRRARAEVPPAPSQRRGRRCSGPFLPPCPERPPGRSLQLFEWVLPPLVISPFGTHTQDRPAHRKSDVAAGRLPHDPAPRSAPASRPRSAITPPGHRHHHLPEERGQSGTCPSHCQPFLAAHHEALRPAGGRDFAGRGGPDRYLTTPRRAK